MDNSDVEDIDLMPKLVANDEPIIETENHEEAEEQILQQELDEIPEDEVFGTSEIGDAEEQLPVTEQTEESPVPKKKSNPQTEEKKTKGVAHEIAPKGKILVNGKWRSEKQMAHMERMRARKAEKKQTEPPLPKIRPVATEPAEPIEQEDMTEVYEAIATKAIEKYKAQKKAKKKKQPLPEPALPTEPTLPKVDTSVIRNTIFTDSESAFADCF